MNSNVHPLVAALVIVMAIVALGIWTWGSGEAANIGGPSELRIDPDGHLYIQIGNQLIEHDSDGAFLRVHDLGDIGVDLFLGSFGFFSNGDILLRRGPDPRSFLDNIRAFQRKTNQHSLAADTPETGMYRCDLDTKACSVFGEEAIDFKAAHGIFIDWLTNDVYIADTTRHVLRKYAEDGAVLAGPIAGFKFPNQLMLFDEMLLVADTNNHVIRMVDAGISSFGDDQGRADVVSAEARAAGQTWPSHFARVGEEWWVNNMRNNMAEGGLYIFDDDWRYVRKAELPRNADPIALVAFDDEVLVSDWNNDRVYRIASNGERLADFESAGLQGLVEDAQEARQRFEVYKYLGVLLFALMFGGVLVRGLAVSMSTQRR
ncbi:MAG: hypothetical protein KJO09_05375 [Gammaproteobacteria bacterium]|nr:hypothetical protein [Gammaproteobacteria bacterium]